MKNLILGLIVAILVCSGGNVTAYSGRTIEASALTGTWFPRRDINHVVNEINEMSSTEIVLEVNSENQALITRKISDGTVEKVESVSFRQVGSLFYWRFERDDGLEYQLVLGGWQLKGGTSVLFGHLYLANSDHGLFNGWPVSVQRDGQLTNKGTGRDKAAPVL